MFLVSMSSPEHLSWGSVRFYQGLFQHLMKCSCGFFSFSLTIWSIPMTHFCILNHTCISWSSLLDHSGFVLYSWILFASVFFSIFASMFMREIGLLLYCIFVWFGYQDLYSLIKRIWQYSFCFYCVQQFEEY